MRRLLDLCCRAGLAGAGYWQSGCFSEIVGVDIQDMRGVYPFDFLQADAFSLDYDFLSQFDVIHMSPPCQGYSTLTPSHKRDLHPLLIPNAHRLGRAWGGTYIIENVGGAKRDLRPNVVMSGRDVGLPMQRNRYFHVYEAQRSYSESESQAVLSSEGNAWNLSERVVRSLHEAQRSYSEIRFGREIKVHGGGAYVSRSDLIEAFGLMSLSHRHRQRLTVEHIEQGIPPMMTRVIALALFDKIMIGG